MGWDKLGNKFSDDSNNHVKTNTFDAEYIVKAIKEEFPYMDLFLVEYAVRSCSKHLNEGASNVEFIKCLKSKLDGFE